MNKDEVKNLILGQILGNKIGVNVFISKSKLSRNKIIKNWKGEIKPSFNLPIEDSWFSFIDHDPSANWEHPVEYIFINDATGKFETIKGTTPPNNLEELEKVQ